MDKKSDLIIMAGPCSIESEDQIMKIAEAVKKSGAEYLRGGAFKPRTEPGWTGYGQKALRWMRKAADKFELKIVTEILNPRHIKMFKDYGVDLYQVGARSTQYQVLLEAVGRANVPVLLKNGPNTTLKEWLGAAARIPKDNVILCARGKNNETDIAKNGQDIVTLAHLVNNVDYPIIFDPSHSSGKREYVYDVVIGAVAMGVDGILVEVHYDPIMARTDGRQSIIPSQLEKLVKDAHEVRKDHLRRKENKNSFIKASIPAHADIYFLSNYRRDINSIVKKLDSKIYREEEIFPKKKKGEKYKILTARIPAGNLGKLYQEGFAIGEVVRYKPKEGLGSAEAIHIKMCEGDKIKLSPYSKDALHFRGKRKYPKFPGKRYDLAHGFDSQPIRDGFFTIKIGKIPELKSKPLIIYRIVEE